MCTTTKEKRLSHKTETVTYLQERKVHVHRKGQMDLHVKRSHNKNPIMCALCYNIDKSVITQFQNERSLKEHTAIYHKPLPTRNILRVVEPQIQDVINYLSEETGFGNLAKSQLNKLSLGKRTRSAADLLGEERQKKNQ